MENDDAYSNLAYIEGGEAIVESWEINGADYRSVEASIGRARLNLPYGPHDRQKLDLFLPAGKPKGLFVFVHGGYWHRFDQTCWSHFAKGAQDSGWAVAMPGYVLAPDATIPEISEMIVTAVNKAAEFVEGPIVLAGHSAGGHLVARLATADRALNPDVARRVQKIVPISPLSDLRPLVLTTMNGSLNLTPESAVSESPALMENVWGGPIHVWVGGNERPAFLDQATWLAQAWNADLTKDAGHNHFTVIDALADKGSALLDVILGS